MSDGTVVSSAYLHHILTEAGIIFPKHIMRCKIICEPNDIAVFECEIAVTIKGEVQINAARAEVLTEIKRFKLVELEPGESTDDRYRSQVIR